MPLAQNDLNKIYHDACALGKGHQSQSTPQIENRQLRDFIRGLCETTTPSPLSAGDIARIGRAIENGYVRGLGVAFPPGSIPLSPTSGWKALAERLESLLFDHAKKITARTRRPSTYFQPHPEHIQNAAARTVEVVSVGLPGYTVAAGHRVPPERPAVSATATRQDPAVTADAHRVSHLRAVPCPAQVT